MSVADMNKSISRKLGDKMSRFCAPLVDHLEISHFYHYIVTHSGHFAAVGLNLGWHECLFSDPELGVYPVPYFYHNREKIKGVIFTQLIANKGWEGLAKVASQDFDVNLGLQINHSTQVGLEAFGFGLKTDDPRRHMGLLNELPLLQLFIKEFKKEIGVEVLRDNYVDIASMIGPSFYEAPKQAAPNLRETILGKMKIKVENPFTERESEVIDLLLDGNSAPQIADELIISKRTVEHHIERIKDKLDCYSKSELIKKLREMKSFLDF